MMKIIQLYAKLLILCSITVFSFGQEPIEDENWLKGFKTEADYLPTLVYRDSKSLSLKNIPQAKKRLNFLREFSPTNEWEGVYFSNTGIGDRKFIWNAKGGFFSFYFYHTLKFVDFGKVNDSLAFIELSSEKSSTKSKLVKIKVGETHFLVPENRLQDFCERAVGLETDSDFFYFNIKEEDINKPRAGLPILPKKYETFIRYPIEAKIVLIGKRKIIPNEQSTKEYNFDDIHYSATINFGKNKKLKKGMNFFIEDLGEWFQITKVSPKSSVGFIRRGFDENNKEQCWDSRGGSGQTIPCKEIKTGITVKTKSDL